MDDRVLAQSAAANTPLLHSLAAYIASNKNTPQGVKNFKDREAVYNDYMNKIYNSVLMREQMEKGRIK